MLFSAGQAGFADLSSTWAWLMALFNLYGRLTGVPVHAINANTRSPGAIFRHFTKKGVDNEE
jgi:hypothetical protein